jgi:AraC-like DNA-binding protein
VDPLSDVLRAVRLNNPFFCLVKAAAPWSVATVAARTLVPHMLPEMQHFISYHILLSGSCWGGLDETSQVRMQPGDVIMFPHGDAHVMSSAEGLLPDCKPAWPKRYPETLFIGQTGAHDTAVVSGFLGCDESPFNPLLTSLPRCMHVSGIATGWLSQFPRQAVNESRTGRAGSETMLTRMAELMFIEVVRHHVAQLPSEQTGWLSGLGDPVVGSALSQLHGCPAYPWTLAELARAIASSRTVLVERFSQLLGVSPMTYLTRWRLQLASEQLTQTTTKIAAIGARVGYGSEAAFSRAFKRDTGLSPSAWRRARRG